MSVTTANTSQLRRTNLWSAELKQVLQDEVMGQGFVRWLTDFPEGDTLNIPSIGEGTVRDYVENTPIVFDAIDTGNFTFTISTYLQSGMYITEKARQDTYYAAQLESSFVPKQARAIAEKVETDIFALPVSTGGQTSANSNAINGVAHRWVADPTTAGSSLMQVEDIVRALYALKKANVPDQSLIAIVDPSVEYRLNTLTNLVTSTSATGSGPIWGDLIQSGIGRGPRFVRNLYGFDFYVSNYLAERTAEANATSSTWTGAVAKTNVATDVYAQNIFFSAASPDIVPFIGAWRQPVKVDSGYNWQLQREEYATTCRYGLKVYRPENLVCILSYKTV